MASIGYDAATRGNHPSPGQRSAIYAHAVSQGKAGEAALIADLRNAVRRCELRWGDSDTYFEVSHLLDEAIAKLDLICEMQEAGEYSEGHSEPS